MVDIVLCLWKSRRRPKRPDHLLTRPLGIPVWLGPEGMHGTRALAEEET